MIDSTVTTVARSAEPSHLTFLIRRLVVVVGLVVGGLVLGDQVQLQGAAVVDPTATDAGEPALGSRPTDGTTDGATSGDGGSTGGAANGTPGDGATDDGTPGNGATDDGTPGNGATDDGTPGVEPTVDGATADDLTEDGSPGSDVAESDETEPGSDEANLAVPLPAGSSRLLVQAPERLLDTRTGELAAATTTHVISVPEGRTAVALSVSILGSTRDGAAFLDGRTGVVEAVAVGQADVTATNLVIVPVAGTELTVRSSAGGDLVVDLVGTFEASEGSASGRFVPVDVTQIARLETALEGHETELPFAAAVPTGQADAVLVLVTADVGTDGGVIRLGAGRGDYNQMLMWSAAVGEDRQRRGLALVEPGADGTAHLLYNGGTTLTVDVVGYFTSDQQEVSTDGLYVPKAPRQLFRGRLTPNDPVEVDGIEPQAKSAVVTVTARSALLDQTWSVLTPVVSGGVSLSWPSDIDADVALLGVFL